MSTDDPTNPRMPAVGDDRCPTCGAAVPAAARFCPNCGEARATADAPDGDSDSTRVMAPVVDTGPSYEEEVVRPAPVVVQDRPWPWALTLGVPAAILLLLLIVLAFRSSDSGESPDDTTTTSEAPATTVTTSPAATTRPTVTRPPATSPPQTSPPQTSPPATDPPATDPPAVTVP